MEPISFENLIQPGNSLKTRFSPGNPNNQLIHIRAIVDDNIVVFRFWSSRKRRWVYDTETMYYFRLLYEANHLEKK